MSTSAAPDIVCCRCRAPLDASDNYCRRCGAATANVAGLPGHREATQFGGAPARWSESPWVILPLLFLILGPFALPLLWRSRRFTTAAKYALTVVTAVYTVFLCWETWVIVKQALPAVRELQRALGG
jgi:hypothetical protein